MLMGFEVCHDPKCRMDPMNLDESSRHKRSKSDSDKKVKDDLPDSSSKSSHHHKLDMEKANGHTSINKKPSFGTKVQSSLKQEILQLEKRLKDQLAVRRTLEKVLGYRSYSIDCSSDSLMPKPTRELIREIAVLELEVIYLEQHLLSLYRKAFDSQKSTLSRAGDKLRQPLSSHSRLFQDVARPVIKSKRDLPQKSATKPVNEHSEVGCQEKLTGPGVHRCHSALSQRAVCSARISPSTGSFSARISPSAESLARALQSFHSQPLSFLEDRHDTSSTVVSLAEYLGTNIADHIPETPNKLSEDMVRCMAAIYCKLADPPLAHHGLPSSPTSSFSSMSAVSPQYLGDMWSPHCKRESTLDARLINPFSVEGLKEFSGPYNTMIEVPLICRDSGRLSDVKDMLQNYKSLAHRLKIVDPRKMKNEEKIAFWINLHNALMMHAYLVYGIPQNNMKKSAILIKASCIVGGRSVSVNTIQGSILGCRTQFRGQWLRTLFSTRMKLKAGDEWQAYAIEHPEPLLHFALCSGSHSDPAVRVYTSKKLVQQLEAAKQEYIRASFGIWKEQKILLPKIIDSYAKDTGLNSRGLVDMIQLYLPETLRMAMQRCQRGRSQKIIEWVPHNFTFRYLLSKELATLQII